MAWPRRWVVLLFLIAFVCTTFSKETKHKPPSLKKQNKKKRGSVVGRRTRKDGKTLKKKSDKTVARTTSKRSKSKTSIETSIDGEEVIQFAEIKYTKRENEKEAYVTDAQEEEVHMYDFLPELSVTLDPSEEYFDEGVGFIEKQKYEKALQQLWAASFFSAYKSGVWYNIAFSIIHLLREPGYIKKVGEKQVHALVCEALYAKDILILLNGDDQDGYLEASLDALVSKYPGGKESCELSEESLLDKQKGEAAYELALEDSQQAAALFCQTSEEMTLKITPKLKRRQVLPAAFMLAYFTRMYVCGVVGISNMFDPNFIDELEEAHMKQYDPTVLRGKPETPTTAHRGGLRYEIRWPLRRPFTDPQLTQNSHLLALVKGALGDNKIELDTFSHVDALPKAPIQIWHQDVEPVHVNTQIGEVRHAPPQGVVAIVPIIDLNQMNGPTEFATGTHVNLPWQKRQENENGEKTSAVRFYAKKGDCILFDLRIRHRGTVNNSKYVRPIIYMSYMHAWYRDAINFRGKQTSEWSEEFETPAARKLFMRADQQRYVEKLEQELSERGVDVKKLQSNDRYSASMIKV